ncbi:hypothetical protein FA13DRAFT_1724263 [Coprinellus micaceus]|uniref:Uncharacterized protein n=1 Tax=Coprinellus micaceus TaxID=71717 RepID=A0A4Y7U0R7_COPMI|nr:hypothetical protein FA13DRAFT_1724263 [Coprinellus micaceus]
MGTTVSQLHGCRSEAQGTWGRRNTSTDSLDTSQGEEVPGDATASTVSQDVARHYRTRHLGPGSHP